MDSKLLVNPGKDHDMIELTSPQAHKVIPHNTNYLLVNRARLEN